MKSTTIKPDIPSDPSKTHIKVGNSLYYRVGYTSASFPNGTIIDENDLGYFTIYYQKDPRKTYANTPVNFIGKDLVEVR